MMSVPNLHFGAIHNVGNRELKTGLTQDKIIQYIVFRGMI